MHEPNELANTTVTGPVFYYDVSSPYAYLAAVRIEEVLAIEPHWQPIAFGALIRQIDKTPWSLRDETRTTGMAEVEGRARERGLPPLRWPPGWPAESYSLLPLRALLVAAEHDLVKQLTLAFYRREFADGVALDDVDVVLDVVAGVGLDRELVRSGIEREEIKQGLRAATGEAVALGVTGVPTVAIDGELFWGDDRLENAAALLERA